jgi:hypothetical protein
VGSKKKKAGVTCLACGSVMKGKDVACRKCGHMREGVMMQQEPGAAKAVFRPVAGPAFLAKAARPRCGRCGSASRHGARHCTSCGVSLLQVVKSAGEAQRDRYLGLAAAEPDPGQRELLWRLAHPDVYGKNGGRTA